MLKDSCWERQRVDLLCSNGPKGQLLCFLLLNLLPCKKKKEKKKKNFYGNPTPPKLKNSSQLMVPPVLQGLISLFPPLNSVGLCVVWQWLVGLALPAWHILKLTHELTWEGFTGKKLSYTCCGLLPAPEGFLSLKRQSNDTLEPTQIKLYCVS